MLAACAGTGGLGVVQWAFFRPRRRSTDTSPRSPTGTATPRSAFLTDQSGVTDRKLLAQLLRGEGYQPPTDVEISSLERDGDAATAIVAYRLGGAAQTSTVNLRRDDEATAGLFHGWRVDGGLAALNAPIAGPGVRLDGVDCPAPPRAPR